MKKYLRSIHGEKTFPSTAIKHFQRQKQNAGK